ncbi:MAG: hypothetical protein JJU20_04845 [Opitutales bacterium]|nr:hypothetical protein [Opitutales bacterium]
MIRRVLFEEWQMTVTLIAFFLSFATFTYFTVRALRMRKKERERMSNLPLEKDENETPKNND